jgi:F0F1-type ATP synthase alpha subunit
VNKAYSGIVFSIKDSIANVLGLSEVTSGEMVKDIYNNIGLVLNLEKS